MSDFDALYVNGLENRVEDLEEIIRQKDMLIDNLKKDNQDYWNRLLAFVEGCSELYRTPYQEFVQEGHRILYDLLSGYRSKEWLERKSLGGDCLVHTDGE